MRTSTARSSSSQAAKGGLNLTLDPIEKFIERGLVSRLQTVLGCPGVILTSTDKAQVLQRSFGNPAAGEQDTGLRYPYFLVTPTGLAEDTGSRANTFMTGRVGRTAVIQQGDGRRAYNVHFLPTEFAMSVEFVCTKYEDQRAFASNWLFARKKGWLNFEVKYGQVVFTMRVDPDGNVALVMREGDAGAPTTYTVQTTLTVQGFISQATLIEQQITHGLQVDSNVGAPGSSTREWSFNREDADPTTDIRQPSSTLRSR